MEEKSKSNLSKLTKENLQINPIDLSHILNKIPFEIHNNNGYDSSDDIENQQLIHITKLSISDCSEKNNETKISLKKINKIDKNDYFQNLTKYRIMNSLSIFILLITFFSISFNKINNTNYFLIVEHLGNSKIQSESNLLILNMAFCVVTISFVFSLLRNVMIKKDKYFSYQEIKEIICFHYGNYYYIANIFFSICLYINHNNIPKKFGLDLIICIITLFLYFKVYSNFMKKQQNIKLNNIFNHLAFKVNISFILAWNVCFLTICSAGFLSLILHNKNLIYTFNLIFQIMLTLISIMAMSYYGDTYFCCIIVIFQIGNTLNKHLFKFDIKNTDYIDKHNFHLILTLFTIICLLGSLIKKQKSVIKKDLERTNDDEEINEIKSHYENLKVEHEGVI